MSDKQKVRFCTSLQQYSFKMHGLCRLV
jgi:hypothetical protein